MSVLQQKQGIIRRILPGWNSPSMWLAVPALLGVSRGSWALSEDGHRPSTGLLADKSEIALWPLQFDSDRPTVRQKSSQTEIGVMTNAISSAVRRVCRFKAWFRNPGRIDQCLNLDEGPAVARCH